MINDDNGLVGDETHHRMDEMIALVRSPGKKLGKVDQNTNKQSAEVVDKNRDQQNANPNSDKDVLDMGAAVVTASQVVDVYLSTDVSYEEALMHCHVVENTEKDINATRRRIDESEDSDSSVFVDEDNEVSDEETIDIGGFHVEGFTIDTEIMDDADSDYGLLDELNSTCSSDEESGEQGRQNPRDFNKNKEIDDPKFMIG
ncbi:hypothetical protein LINPERHAP1_LOCUS22878 [Linum perenne]